MDVPRAVINWDCERLKKIYTWTLRQFPYTRLSACLVASLPCFSVVRGSQNEGSCCKSAKMCMLRGKANFLHRLQG